LCRGSIAFLVSPACDGVARETEEAFARAWHPVISNSSAYRMDEDVPALCYPEIIRSTLV
jgi:aspartate-semialdehyde dehydrogenase